MNFLAVRAEHLAVLRIVVFSVWLILIATTDTSIYPLLPEGLSNPGGVGDLLGLPLVLRSPALVQGLWIAAMIGCALCAVGARPYGPIASITALLVLYHDALMKSFGSYTNHAQVVPLLLVLLLPLFPAADAFSVSRRRRPATLAAPWLYRTPLVAAAAILCLTYSFIGARRLFLGAVGIYTDESMLRWIVARTLEYGAHDVSLGLSVPHMKWLWPLLGVGLLITTVFEVLSPVALRASRFRFLWVAVIALFHLSTLVLMDIFFWENLILLAVLFTPITDWTIDRVRGRSGDARHATAQEADALAGDPLSP